MEREEATTTTSQQQQQHNEEEERGAGGKIKRPIVRRHNRTPYSSKPSPRTQQNEHGGDGGGWWLSRLISGGATKFFPSFFSKPLLSADNDEEQLGSEVKEATSDDGLEEFHDIQETRAIEGGQVSLEAEVSKGGSDMNVPAGNTLHRSSDGTEISQLEQMLKGRTFSRDDLNRLTEILKSRIAVRSDVDECGKRNSDATAGEAVVASLSQENPEGPHDDKRDVYIHRVIGESSSPFPKSVSQDLVGASPIDIAKAYMGRRTSESGVGSQGVNLKEETTPVLTRGILPRSSAVSPSQKSSICWPGAMVHESHPYLTPQTERGRVGLHTARRTPYSRAVHSRSISKLEGAGERFDNILSTNLKQLQTPVYGGSQVRRTSVSSHYNGFGSVGPIRRPHRKFFETMTPSRGTRSSHLATSGPFGNESFDASKNLVPMVKQNVGPGASTSGSTKFQPIDAKPSSSIGFSTVNNQSSDMAKKILEHLDRTIPTPEKKSAELKLATSWRKTPSSECTTSTVKDPVSNPFVKSTESQQSSHIIGQKFFDQEKEIRSSLQNDQPGKKKPEEAANAVKTNSLGSTVFSREVSSGNSALQFNAEPSTEVKKTSAFEVSRNEVSIRHDERSQSEKIQRLPQQSEVGGRSISKFTRRDAGYEAPTVPKKVSAHTFGNKPPLTSISVTKSYPKSRASFDNGSGFTFPVSASSGSLLDPPTPSIMPSFSATGPRPKENSTIQSSCSLKEGGGPSYSFGSKSTAHTLVFSFASSSSPSPGDYSTPKFSFGSDKTRISFRSVGGDAVCS